MRCGHRRRRGDLERYQLTVAFGIQINSFEDFGEEPITVVVGIEVATYLRARSRQGREDMLIGVMVINGSRQRGEKQKLGRFGA